MTTDDMPTIFGIKHRPSGRWLHIRCVDSGANLTTDDQHESWCAFRQTAEANAVLFASDDWVVEPIAFDYAALKAFSCGRISLSEALDRLHAGSYTTLLRRLGSFGLVLHRLPDEVAEEQLQAALRTIAHSAGFSETRRATVAHDADGYTVRITDPDGPVDSFSGTYPAAVAQWLLDRRVYLWFVEEDAGDQPVRAAMRRILGLIGAAYEHDVIAWSAEQASLLRSGKLSLVDIEHIAEEIEDIGSEKKFALQSLITKITVRLFMLEFSHATDPRKGWIDELANFRSEALARIDDTPSLKSFANDLFAKGWKCANREVKARFAAFNEKSEVPDDCPYTMDQAVNMEFIPGSPH